MTETIDKPRVAVFRVEGVKNATLDRLALHLKEAALRSSAFERNAAESGATTIPWPYGLDPAELTVLHDEEPTHNACCSLKATAITAGGHYFVHESNKAKRPPQTMVARFDQLFERGLDDFIYRCQSDFESLGNSFFEIIRNREGMLQNRTAVGAVVALRHVHAYTVERCAPTNPNGAYVQKVNGTEVYFRAFGDPPDKYPADADGEPINELYHLMRYTPSNAWYGLPAIWSALYSTLGNRFEAQHLVEYFEDKGVARYLLIMDGAESAIDTDDEATISRYVNSLMEDKACKVVVVGTPLGATTRVETLRDEIRVEDFESYRAANRDEICRVHHVPLRLVNIVTSGSLGGTGEGESQYDYFKALTNKPNQGRWVETFDRVFFNTSSRYQKWSIGFKEVDLEDIAKQSDAATQYVEHGVYSINDALASLGKPGIGPLGDKRFIIAGGEPMLLENLTGMTTVSAPVEDESDDDDTEEDEE